MVAAVAGTNTFPAGTIIIGSTPISGGSNTFFLYDNNGVVGETSSLFPTGPAGGDLAGTYPNPTLNTAISTAVAFSGLGATTVADATQSTSSTTGSLKTAGGIAAAKNIYSGGAIVTGSTANAIQFGFGVGSTTTGFVAASNNSILVCGSASNLTSFAGCAQFFFDPTNGAGFRTDFIQLRATNTTTVNAILSTPAAATLQLGAADVASGAVAQTVTFQGNTGASTTGPLALIKGALGGSGAASVGGELRLQGGLSGAAAGTGGAISIYGGGALGAGTTPVLGLTVAANGASTFAQPVTLAVAKPLSFTSGTNQRAGNATLVGGTVTVSNTTVTANTVVILTRKTSGGTIGTAITYTVSAATSFTITSDNILDTSTFSYMLIEVP